jgi:hypothetical protein
MKVNSSSMSVISFKKGLYNEAAEHGRDYGWSGRQLNSFIAKLEGAQCI